MFLQSQAGGSYEHYDQLLQVIEDFSARNLRFTEVAKTAVSVAEQCSKDI
mgnify:CR=1 FL=1